MTKKKHGRRSNLGSGSGRDFVSPFQSFSPLFCLFPPPPRFFSECTVPEDELISREIAHAQTDIPYKLYTVLQQALHNLLPLGQSVPNILSFRTMTFFIVLKK